MRGLFDIRHWMQKTMDRSEFRLDQEGHLMENLATARMHFSTAEIGMLDKAISQLKIFGDRYTELEQKRVAG